ncbi:YfzA family protein [Heyndrickxia sporothermodurans]
MTDKQKNLIPFFKSSWLRLIGLFILLQIIFIILEISGWVANLNLRDINGKLFGRIAESSIFREWFTFYDTPHFNLFTVFFGITLLVPGIVGAIKDIFSRKSISN